MTATNATIRQTIYDALGNVLGVNRYQFPESSVQAPAACVGAIEFERSTFDGGRRCVARVVVLVSPSDDEQLFVLDRMLDPSDDMSVLAAIDSVTDIDGVSLAWSSTGGYEEVTWNGIGYLGTTVTVDVWV